MKYTGNFRQNPEPDRQNPEPVGRDFRVYNATAEDVIAMANGGGYTVRYGKQPLGYFGTKRQALFEAGRSDGKAYKICRDGNRAYLEAVEDDEDQSLTPSELIADKIREQIGAGDAPLSPLAKQRVVMMLHNACRDKQISSDAYQILYPASLKEQFERLWNNVDSINHEPTPPSDNFLQYAEAREMKDIALAILQNDVNACKSACSRRAIAPAQFEDLYSNAVQNDCVRRDDTFVESILRHIAREAVARRIDGDIFRMINTTPYLKVMASTGNEDGIIEHLTSSGYSIRESEEIASEILSIGKMLSMM